MTLAICDDEPSYRTLIQTIIEDFCKTEKSIDLSVFSFSGPGKLLKKAKAINGFDIYILDIIMPEMNGIELGMQLREAGLDGKIIYLTSSPEYAVESYKTKADNYLLKPFRKSDLLDSLTKITNELSVRQQKSILVKTSECHTLINYDNITYAELYNRSIIYHLADSSTVKTPTIRVSFTEAMQRLLEDKRFLQCGQSIIVNLQHISKIGAEEITFKNSASVFFNKRNSNAIRTAWSEYWHKENKNSR